VALIPLPLSVDLTVALHVLLSGIGTPLLREGVAIPGACWAGLVLLFWWRRAARRNGAEQGPLASSGSARRAA
jgi:hypothetical protein